MVNKERRSILALCNSFTPKLWLTDNFHKFTTSDSIRLRSRVKSWFHENDDILSYLWNRRNSFRNSSFSPVCCRTRPSNIWTSCRNAWVVCFLLGFLGKCKRMHIRPKTLRFPATDSGCGANHIFACLLGCSISSLRKTFQVCNSWYLCWIWRLLIWIHIYPMVTASRKYRSHKVPKNCNVYWHYRKYSLDRDLGYCFLQKWSKTILVWWSHWWQWHLPQRTRACSKEKDRLSYDNSLIIELNKLLNFEDS